MNPQDNQDLESRLQELERQIDNSPSVLEVNQKREETSQPQKNSQNLERFLVSIQQWFNSLPTPGKLAVIVVGVIIGFSLLNSVLRLVSSLLSVAILGVVLYVLYKIFIARRSSE